MMPVVIALAGRRVDPPDADPPRFPLANLPLVRERLRGLFAQRQASALVCSAACGADLLALEVAVGGGMHRRIVLPFEPGKFRETSVTDRPGEWGALYDSIVGTARQAGDLVVLENAGEGGAAYAAANERILEEAVSLTPTSLPDHGMWGSEALAVIVWEGASRGADDATHQFADLARKRGLEVEEVRTLGQDAIGESRHV
jgi:hypothetical protein